MKRRNWRKLAICSWQLGSKDFVSRAFCPDFMACQGLKTVSMITWLLNDSILSMQKDARRFHHVWICIDVRFTTKAQIFHWWNSESVKGQGSIFGETCRVTEIRKIQQNDHHSISILSSYISNPFTMCFRFLPKLFTSLRFKGAAEPRAIGPIHRADQRTDAGTPSADQAGQNIAWSILRHLLGFPSRLPIQETAEGGTTESPLRHLPSVPWKNASRKHMEWGHSTWIFMTLWSASTAPSFWNKTMRVEIVWNGGISSHRDRFCTNYSGQPAQYASYLWAGTQWNPDFFAHQLAGQSFLYSNEGFILSLLVM